MKYKVGGSEHGDDVWHENEETYKNLIKFKKVNYHNGIVCVSGFHHIWDRYCAEGVLGFMTFIAKAFWSSVFRYFEHKW